MNKMRQLSARGRRWSHEELLRAVKMRQEDSLNEHEIAARTGRTHRSVKTQLSQLGRWKLDGERRPFLPPIATEVSIWVRPQFTDADEMALAKASLAYEISCAIKERRTSPPFKPSSWV
jgi:hypothetical protein